MSDSPTWKDLDTRTLLVVQEIAKTMCPVPKPCPADLYGEGPLGLAFRLGKASVQDDIANAIEQKGTEK